LQLAAWEVFMTPKQRANMVSKTGHLALGNLQTLEHGKLQPSL
jgi:hypothetical protein